jgi:tetratricopeptide repeat protein 21B
VELKNKVFKVANQTISAALELPDVKTKKKQQKGKRKEISSILPFGEEERANLFVMKIEVLNELKMFDEAKKMLHLAVAEFADTPQEVKIILTNSDLAIKSGDIKKAINMLKKIGPDSTHFQQAKIKMGEIYLTHLMDRRHYTKCYMDLIKSNETVENYRLVGDAMMRIQEPEEAIQFYEKALQNSEDSSLVREIGHALVMTHDYKRAIKYYENALDVDPKQMLLREDLTNLYIKLGEYEEAKRILTLAIQILREETSSKTKSNTQPNLKTQCSHVTMLLLLSQVLLDENKSWKLSKNEKAKEFFLHAGELQSQIIEKKREMRSDQIDAEKEVLADINYRLGEYAELRENNMKDAEDYYTEALRAAPANKKALLSLAKLYMRKGEYDQCSHYCQKLLKVDPSNEFSSFMLADIMLIKSNPEQAINCYKNLLANEANNYKALAQLIVLLRRAGRLPDAPAFLEAASKRCPRSIEAGLAYAKGLYCRYTGQAQDALRNFNLGRQDGVFGRDSLINMIELYLNPDDDVLWSTSDQNIKVNEECLGAAESLIKEFKERAPQDPLVGIYEAYSGIFRRQKPIIEKSLGKLSEILQQKKEYVPALVAMSIAKFLMKKQTDVLLL